MTDEAQRIYELLQDFDTAMLVTHDEDRPHARPMALACVDANCDVWFFTGRGQPLVHELQNDQDALIVCQDEQNYVTVRGRAELVVDRGRAQQFWLESYRAWFPGGVEDPQLLLIHVHAEDGAYWDDAHPNGVHCKFDAVSQRLKR
jgi:general stress protein 26